MIALAILGLIALALLAAGLAVLRIVAGPTHADRIVALDIFLAAGIALCVAASLASGRTVFLDVGIGLALVGFVATIGWARLVERSPREAATDGEIERPAHEPTDEPRVRPTAVPTADPAAPHRNQERSR